MADSNFVNEINKRRTFAIISHPDAGKTTVTEKLLLFGGVIQDAGTVKARKASRYATSDWMQMEKERGISVTSSVMQFPYKDFLVNLLDTPGHADFSEDTYRTLTAVDSALMVIDCAKGVEERTIKLMDVCRLRNTPIFTFINKLDREGKEPIELLDEIESVLSIKCAPVTWPIGRGREFKGFVHLYSDTVHLFSTKTSVHKPQETIIPGLDNPELDRILPGVAEQLREEIELIKGIGHTFDHKAYLQGELTPVFFGSAVNNFGVEALLNGFVKYAPAPQSRVASQRQVQPEEEKFSGFVFKIQANMDPRHRDRVAFLRICSGMYQPGMKVRHVSLQREVKLPDALMFMASSRKQIEQAAYPGDIIGLHNHGTIRIGDTFTVDEDLQFLGIPNFAPELFRRARLRDPLKVKALLKGLGQLCEEGAVQLFKPMMNNDLILGAVGVLQFDVVAHRLQHEYGVDCHFESVNANTVRWVKASDQKELKHFKDKVSANLALDHFGALVYVASTHVNLQIIQERYPDITFSETREQGVAIA